MQGPGWRILYREERDRLLVSRLRWASGLATVGAMFLAVQITLSKGDDEAFRLIFALDYVVVSVATLFASWVTSLRRREVALTLGFDVALLAVMAMSFHATRTDLAAAPSSLVATMLGTTLFSWGAWAQGAAAATVVAYLAVLVTTPDPSFAASFGFVPSAAVVSVVSTRLIDGYRATSFERTW